MLYTIVLVILLAAGLFNTWSRADERGSMVVFDRSALPAKMADWTFECDNKVDSVVRDMLQYDTIQWRRYKRGDQWADLLVLYGHRKRTFHLPDSCLAGAGIKIKSRNVIALTMPDGTLVPFHALVLDGDDGQSIALYTFVSPGGRATDLLGLNVGMLMCRVRGVGPKGAAIRVIGPLDPSKPLASQAVCDLAVAALKEVCKRVEHAAPMAEKRRACAGGRVWQTC